MDSDKRLQNQSLIKYENHLPNNDNAHNPKILEKYDAKFCSDLHLYL